MSAPDPALPMDIVREVGIVLARRALANPWIDHLWSPHGVLFPAPECGAGTLKWDRVQVRTVCQHDRSIILACNGHRLASHRFQQISRSALRFAWLYVGLADCDVLPVVPAEASQLIAILCKGSSDDTERTESRFELFSDCCSIDSMTSFPTEPHSQGCQCREPRAQHLWPAS
jgi:hypothetical protein